MNPRVERSIQRIAARARGRFAALLGSARTQTSQAAGRIQKGKKPLKTLSRLGLKLTDVSHRTTARVVRQQSTLLENQLDALAQGLREAAKARSVRELIAGQARRIPQNTARLIGDGRETLSIVAGAGGEVRDLLAGTMAEFRGKTRRVRKAPVKAGAATKTRRKSPTRAKKAPATKVRAKTATAGRKTVTRSARPVAQAPAGKGTRTATA